MNQTSACSSTNLQLHHNFRWVLTANHMEPVLGFLGRYLRRKQITAEATAGAGTSDGDLSCIVEWIPRLWRHLNRLIETHNSAEMTIGEFELLRQKLASHQPKDNE
jgi:neuron navigator 2